MLCLDALAIFPGRSLRGNVDRNMRGEYMNATKIRRSLRGNVDRNDSKVRHKQAITGVVPYVGTWIEIARRYLSIEISMSFPTWERG